MAHLLSPHQPWASPVVAQVRTLPQSAIPTATVWLPTQGAKRAFRQAWAATGGGLMPRLLTYHADFPELAPLGFPPSLWPTESETAAVLTHLHHALSQAGESLPPSPAIRWQQAQGILELLTELAHAGTPPEALWRSVPEHLAQHWHEGARVLQSVTAAYQYAVRQGTLADVAAFPAARWQAMSRTVQTGHHLLVAPPQERQSETAFLQAAQSNPHAHIFTLESTATPNPASTYTTVAAPHRAAEALAIASAARQAIEQQQTPVVLAIGEPALATLVIHHLRAADLAPRGFIPHPLGQTPLGHLLQTLSAFAANPQPQGRQLAVLAHIQSVLVPAHTAACAWLEEKVLRGIPPRSRRAGGWLGKLQRTRAKEETAQHKQAALDLFTHWQSAGLFQPPTRAGLGEWCDWLHTLLDAVWPQWREDLHAALWQANCRAWHAPSLGLNGAAFHAWLEHHLALWCTEDSARPDPAAPILTGRLAGWSGAHTLIVGGLSERQWQPTQPHQWLSEGQRAALGLPTNATARTLADAELAHLLSSAGASHVILTRSLAEGITPMAPSPVFAAFLNALPEAQRTAAHRRGSGLLPTPTAPVPSMAPTSLPLPAAPVWSPSAIESLLACPYKTALTRRLKLQPWEDFDAFPTAADFGNLLHKAAEQFWQTHPAPSVAQADAPAAIATLQSHALTLLERDHPEQMHLWAPRIRTLCIGLVELWVVSGKEGWDNLGTESKLTATLATPQGPVTVEAFADKLDIRADGARRVVDYKTGQIPFDTEMKDGRKPQLPLLAWILHQNGAPLVEAAFWHLVGYNAKAVEPKPLKDTAAHIQRVQEDLGRVLEPFAHGPGDVAFPATPGLANAGILPSGPCEKCPAAGWCRYPAWAGRHTAQQVEQSA